MFGVKDYSWSWDGNDDLKSKVLENRKKFYQQGKCIPMRIKFEVAALANRGLENPYPDYQYWYDIVKEGLDLFTICCFEKNIRIEFIRLTTDLYLNHIDKALVSDSQVEISKNSVRKLGPKNFNFEMVV